MVSCFFFALNREKGGHQCRTRILTLPLPNAARENQPLPELHIRVAKICFPSMTRSTRTKPEKRVWSTRRSCFRQMHHRSMLTGKLSGTLLRAVRNNGTHSLQGVLFLPCREKSQWRCIRR